jgi:hypothetical protein
MLRTILLEKLTELKKEIIALVVKNAGISARYGLTNLFFKNKDFINF